MSFDFQMYNQRYLENVAAGGPPINDAAVYDVRIVEAEVAEGESYWQVIGVHHLTPEENRGKHNVFLEALDEEGQRVRAPFAWVGWTWEGRRPEERTDPVPLDKPANEPANNIVMYFGQIVSVWLNGLAADATEHSDRVENLHTNHPDEPGPHGELWNSVGHHSFYVVFQRTRKRSGSKGLPDEPPQRQESVVNRVQFTVYHPKEIKPEVWYTLLAYTHLPTAIEDIKADSKSRLGQEKKNYRRGSDETTQVIKRGAEIMVVPELPGCLFNPPRSTFLWLENWHRLEFRLQAGPDIPGFELDTIVKGQLAFYVGPVLVGEVKIWTYISQEVDDSIADQSEIEVTADIYQAIFPSYSHKDTAIVEQLEKAYAVLGMQSLRDVHILRSGEKWNPALLKKIEEADIFQLCWSNNAKESRYVEQEWRYALKQDRPAFIRPTYWEKPMPDPPPELSDIHFAHLEL